MKVTMRTSCSKASITCLCILQACMLEILMTSECLCLQVGGYVQQYKGGFTFASVRGAGHMVPSSQPERGLTLLDSFLKGMLPPYVPEQ
jgi:hypothetical protein